MGTSSSILARRSTRALVDPMPSGIAPMLALAGEMPARQDAYCFEYKWDGVRAICYCGKKKFQLQSRNLLDITRRYPELHAIADAVGKTPVVLDGEIVSLDDSGRPSFKKLQRRMHLNVAHEISALTGSQPVFYILFDVLYADGRQLLDQPYHVRRARLEALALAGPNWQVTPAHVGDGAAMLENARRTGLEGLLAKRLDSIYEPGRRSPSWIKLKIIQRQEFVIGGWVPERSCASNRIGAILVGYYDGTGRLRYAGKVGTGLSAGDHVPLLKRLTRHPIAQSPFADPVPPNARFCKPQVVVEIEFRRWPESGMLQHAVYAGLRSDKKAREVVKEPPQIDLEKR
jgi:bifunctional non-homologous end joining protein LigD